ncbi:uncharacterized protein A4U43_C10F5600 [Asparagus officinalis]|uniref:Uncharacterized protein n=1 Tax=Asparagus officinalis TaxID=4686 RepID=A0A5P1E0Z6_ASPOF|nr:uncharacterized protein A4U43_C10F5600 [Asparagus officinalis]
MESLRAGCRRGGGPRRGPWLRLQMPILWRRTASGSSGGGISWKERELGFRSLERIWGGGEGAEVEEGVVYGEEEGMESLRAGCRRGGGPRRGPWLRLQMPILWRRTASGSSGGGISWKERELGLG